MSAPIKALLKRLIPARFRPKLRLLYNRYRYSGFSRYCPFCKAHLGRFLPVGLALPVFEQQHIVGGGLRLDALCPICGSVDRERLVYLYLVHRTDIFQIQAARSRRLLHVAPELRLEKILNMSAAAEYLTADLASSNVMVSMDITDIRFPDNSFDAIICNHVLEHVIDDRKAMSELYRVLKPGGWAILQVPLSLKLDRTYEDNAITSESGREEAFGQSDHVRIYARDYKDRLARTGFEVEVFNWVAEFGSSGTRFGLNPEERVYIAKKNP